MAGPLGQLLQPDTVCRPRQSAIASGQVHVKLVIPFVILMRQCNDRALRLKNKFGPQPKKALNGWNYSELIWTTHFSLEGFADNKRSIANELSNVLCRFRPFNRHHHLVASQVVTCGHRTWRTVECGTTGKQRLNRLNALKMRAKAFNMHWQIHRYMRSFCWDPRNPVVTFGAEEKRPSLKILTFR